MSNEKVISFEDLLKGPSKEKMKEMKPDELYLCASEYWKRVQEGETFSSFIDYFKKNFDGSPASLLTILTKMNLDLLENDNRYMEDDFVKKNGYDDTMFAYADLYRWFAENLLNKQSICDLLTFNFNGDLPVVLQFGEKIQKDLVSISNAHDYDEIEDDYPLKMFSEAILKHMDDKMEQFCLMAFVSDDPNEGFSSEKLAFMPEKVFNESGDEEQDFSEIREAMLAHYKSNIIQLMETGGQILMLYQGKNQIHANGFSFEIGEEDVTCSVLDKDGFTQLVENITSISNETGCFDELMPILACANFEIADLDLQFDE